MKTINYTGSSKLISRIVNLLNRRAPLPLDGDGDPDWGSNGQVLSTDGNGNTAWVNQGGGGSGGHTIWNRIKTALTARGKLWFADASVSDVSADDATKVEVVTELLNETAFDNLATDGTADGIYTFPDSGGEYLTAEMVGIWILHGRTPNTITTATWNTDSRCANSVLLTVQIQFDGDWYNMAQTNGFMSVGQGSDGYPILYVQNSGWFDLPCRAIMALMS